MNTTRWKSTPILALVLGLSLSAPAMALDFTEAPAALVAAAPVSPLAGVALGASLAAVNGGEHRRLAASVVSTNGADGPVGEVYIGPKRVFHFPGDAGGKRAQALAKRLNEALAQGELRADRLRPARHGATVAIYAGKIELMRIDPAQAQAAKARPEALALQHLTELRTALGFAAPAQVASRGLLWGRWQKPVRVVSQAVGHASWYGPGFHGRRTASGERFDMNALTAAHKTLPFNTRLRVTNLRTKKQVIVRVTDRGPFIRGRMLDLSRAAARTIGLSGVGQVRIEILGN